MTDTGKHHSATAVVDGDRAVVEWTSRARTPHGERYANFCIGAFTVRDGKIRSVREYVDTAYAQRVLFDRGRAAA
jgi:ketosteroid isomerase-like protein